MYTAVIFYFSGTGNTWWVADNIKKQLDARNINADIVSIDSVNVKKANWWLKTADLIFFGWPVYGSDLPVPMKRFIDNLLVIEKGKHIHTFCTQMMFSGDGAWLFHKNFEKKGLIIDSAAHFKMPSNLSMLNGILCSPKSEKKILIIMGKCKKHVEKYVNSLLMGKSRIKGKFAYPLGIVQRAPYRLFYKRFQNLVGVDTTQCTHCGLCQTLCPEGNIQLNPYPEFSGKCALCLRCYAFCPTSAITVCGKRHNVQKKKKPYSLHDKRFIPTILK